MSSQEQLPGTSVEVGASPSQRRRDRSSEPGPLNVSELAADRAAAPSPFGDDLTFPLPVEELRYTPTTAP